MLHPPPVAGSREKLGVALSGGGFRAAFFHIGVFAELAERGLLRKIEVLSTVSGGSIVGALFYLHVKRLLESKSDEEITDEDYVAIVRRLETDFLAVVEQNLRVRVFCDGDRNHRMMGTDWSRTEALGELYDELLYRPVLAGTARPSEGPVLMRELKIRPRGDRPDFHPLRHNEGRSAKVPVLRLNATSLNSGHNWRFEASRMGEPPATGHEDLDIDKNVRYQRAPDYESLPGELRDFPLGKAVAASACVPALFPPITIRGLYGEDTIRLVDGGVHDNQGIEGLVDPEMGVTRYFVSDASGQMRDDARPSTTPLGAYARSTEIALDRVREETLTTLRTVLPDATALVHLRRGLGVPVVEPAGADGRAAGRSVRLPPDGATPVHPEVQDRLSRIRTDLDAFSEVEASSLMLDGYVLAGAELDRRKAFPERRGRGHDWRFLEVAPALRTPSPRFLKHLEAGEKRFLRVARLDRRSAVATWVVGFFALAAVSGLLVALDAYLRYSTEGQEMSAVTILVLPAVVYGCYLVALRMAEFDWVRRLNRMDADPASRLVGRTLGWAFSVVPGAFLATYNARFVAVGRLERLRAEGALPGGAPSAVPVEAPPPLNEA